MRFAILSRGSRLYSTRRLKEAAINRGHKVDILDTLQFSIIVQHKSPDLMYRSKPVRSYDAVIPRIGASITFFGTAVVRQFEQMGVFTLNSSGSISVSRDKLRSLQVMSRHDIGLPSTVFVRRKEDVLPAINHVGGAPVIVKLLEGTQGVGVILAESSSTAEAIIETLHGAKQNVLVQKFVAESKGKDVRAFVVGGQVVAAMRRTAKGQEFRSNVHRGGSTQSLTLDPHYEQAAVRAAQIMGLHVAGVDMLEGADGPQIMEVNSSPGLEGIEKATKIDVASAIIEHMEQQVRFPELDVRQRLTLRTGYVVAEVPIAPSAPLVGMTIKDSGLRDQDIIVLSIERSNEVIANPKTSRTIEAGDILLCYGKSTAINSILPERTKKKRKRGRTT